MDIETVKKRSGIGMHKANQLTNLGRHLVLLFFTLIILYPIAWMVMASFKTSGELSSNLWGLPQHLRFENYKFAWVNAELGTALFNSLLVSLSVVFLVVTLSGFAAYGLAHFKWQLAIPIFLLLIFTMQAPVPLIPMYVLIVKLKLTDSYLGLILPSVAAGLPLSIFIFRAFFLGVPSEIMDAARVDGCNNFQAFLRIVVPISGPAIATVAILQFVGTWNEYVLPLIVVRSAEMRTLPLAIQVFFRQWGQVEWVQVFAALSIGTIPIIVLYILLQRQFIKGLTSGAVKG
jgi:raffinose/stachyose/melibiose transport system permease protein